VSYTFISPYRGSTSYNSDHSDHDVSFSKQDIREDRGCTSNEGTVGVADHPSSQNTRDCTSDTPYSSTEISTVVTMRNISSSSDSRSASVSGMQLAALPFPILQTDEDKWSASNLPALPLEIASG